MPFFKLNCDGGYPVLPISGDNYIVHNISYDRATMELGKRVPSESYSNCSNFPNRNLTLERTPFSVSDSSNASLLLFFFHCNLTQLQLPPAPGIPGAGIPSLPCDPQQAGFGSFVGYSPLLPLPDRARLLQACSPLVSLSIAPFPHSLGAVTRYEPLMDFRVTLNWTAPACDECKDSGGRCGIHVTDSNNNFNFICICSDRDRRVSCNGTDNSPKRIISKLIIGCATGVGLLVVLLFLFKSFQRCSKVNLEETKTIEIFLEEYISLALRRYTYSKLKNMTKSFSEQLGQGGYGRVFKGKLEDDRLVAVKLLNESTTNGQEFMNEVASIGRTNHVNIVGLHGFCSEGSKRALVYEFMPNGSLEKFLSNKNLIATKSLQWEDLYKIAVGIAKGLEYLHKGCTTKVVHFDIKPHNILLDEDFNPKISDFGLAKLCPSKGSILSMNVPRGTIGYIAPEVFSRNFGVVSSKSDVYSYGMLVLEMVGVRNNHYVTQSSETSVYFPHWIYEKFNENGSLKFYSITNNEFDHDLVKKMILIGLWCIQTNPIERPSISKVVEMLDGKSEELALPPKHYIFSPTRSIKESDSTLTI